MLGDISNKDTNQYQSSNEFLIQKNWQKKFELRKSRAVKNYGDRQDPQMSNHLERPR